MKVGPQRSSQYLSRWRFVISWSAFLCCGGLLLFPFSQTFAQKVPGKRTPAAEAKTNAAKIPDAVRKEPGKFQVGRVATGDAVVYAEPDFDSDVLGRVKPDTTWWMSKAVYGAFYQVFIGERVGFVSDVDIVPINATKGGKTAGRGNGRSANESESSSGGRESRAKEGARLGGGEIRKARAFLEQSYQGISFLGLRYREETMGLRPTDNMLLFGFKASGIDVVSQGLTTELNAQISFSPPKYYEQATGHTSEGFLFLLDAMVVNANTHGRDTQTFFGFGPMFRFSKYSVTLPVSGKSEYYSLEDMALGAKFNLGIAQRWGSFSTRLDLQYMWEKMQYFGIGLALQWTRD